MATTIPALTSVDDILDTDLVMVTHSNGQSYKIPGTALNKRNQVVISANTTLTGTPLKTGNVVRAYFTADLVANNSSTPLTLSYNSVSYTVKVPKNGALANYLPFDVGGGVYKYLQAYTTLELIFDGTYFVVLGNPVVLSSADYTIYPDGAITDRTYINNEDITSQVYAFPYIDNPAIFLQRSGKMIMLNITTGIDNSAERYTPIFRLPNQYRINNMEHDINFYCITSTGKAYNGVMNTAGEMFLVSESGLQAETLVKMHIVYALP